MREGLPEAETDVVIPEGTPVAQHVAMTRRSVLQLNTDVEEFEVEFATH